MHALIGHFAHILPTWLLLETDWASTKQAGPFMPCCSDIVSIGRLRWIEGTTMSGKQNFAWYPFQDPPPSRANLLCARGGTRGVTRQGVWAMWQTLSDASFRLQVLW